MLSEKLWIESNFWTNSGIVGVIHRTWLLFTYAAREIWGLKQIFSLSSVIWATGLPNHSTYFFLSI